MTWRVSGHICVSHSSNRLTFHPVIEKLGNPGWNWDNYLRYSKKPETFVSFSKLCCVSLHLDVLVSKSPSVRVGHSNLPTTLNISATKVFTFPSLISVPSHSRVGPLTVTFAPVVSGVEHLYQAVCSILFCFPTVGDSNKSRFVARV